MLICWLTLYDNEEFCQSIDLFSISALLQPIWINKPCTGLCWVYALPVFLFNDRLKLNDNARQAYGIIMTYF